MIDQLSLDQVRVFLAVVESGSFSAAARALGRAQSVISYTIANFEDRLGLPLFDRSGLRPRLTEAGRALLGDARRVASDMDALAARARGLGRGLEAEVAIVADVMYPMAALVAALAAFRETFPSVPPRVHVESLGAVGQRVMDGTSVLGLAAMVGFLPPAIQRVALPPVRLVAVVAPGHALAAVDGPLPAALLRDQLQLVLTDRSEITAGQDFAVLSTQTWRLADLGAKHAMLLAGLGWGGMPAHMVEADLAAGRLVRIQPEDWPPGGTPLPMHLIHRGEAGLGPATRWLAGYLVGGDRRI